ncbi:MAG: hypothetical protein WCC17_19150 [Candidatus Nitrosopolaris sp.]
MPAGIVLFIFGLFSVQLAPTSIGAAMAVISDTLSRLVFRTKDQLRFFIDYHAHSVDTIEVLKNGFGRESGILGSYLYTMNAINIELPKEPGLTNIGLARDHL